MVEKLQITNEDYIPFRTLFQEKKKKSK